MVAVGAVALVSAALLSRCSDEGTRGVVPVSPTPTKQVDFPRERALRALQARARNNAPAPPTPSSIGRDRLSRAMSSPGKNGAVMIEVNALRHSPLVEAVLECRKAQRTDDANGLELLKEEFGIDITQDVDRVGIDSEVLGVSGFFAKLQLPEGLGEGTAYGDAARVYSITTDDEKPAFMAKVGDDLILTSTDESQIKAAVDRAEGRADAPPSFPEGIVGGEIYGLIGPELIKSVLGVGDNEQFKPFLDMLTTSALRVAVDDDAAVSLDIGARSADDARQLSRALNGAIAGARADARSSGNLELAALLEQARVAAEDDGTIAVDIAVPGADLLRILGCPVKGAPSTTTSP